MDNAIAIFKNELKEYNKHTNIYSSKAYPLLDFHIQDSLYLSALIKEKKAQHILDIGSGSGLPAIFLALALPKTKITAVESKSRKTKFLEHIKKTLKLENLNIIQEDIHVVIKKETLKIDTVTAKAFGSYQKIKDILKKYKKNPLSLYIPISKNQLRNLKKTSDLNYHSSQNEEFHYIYSPNKSDS